MGEQLSGSVGRFVSVVDQTNRWVRMESSYRCVRREVCVGVGEQSSGLVVDRLRWFVLIRGTVVTVVSVGLVVSVELVF